MAKFCAYCGTQLLDGQLFCSGCGADLVHASINQVKVEAGGKLHSNFSTASSSQNNLNTRLFDQPMDVLIIDWAFPQNNNGKIYTKSGELIGELSRSMTEKGIDYSIIDVNTKDAINIAFNLPTHYALVSSSQGLIADIEKRIVKETLEIRPTPDTTEIFTELENFTMRKTFYLGDDENEIGYISRLKDEEKPLNLIVNNPYRILIKNSQINIRKLLGLVIAVLVLYKSNPYQ